MAFKVLSVTISATNTKQQVTATRTPCCLVAFSPAIANTATVKVGDSTITSTVFARELQKPTTTLVETYYIGPFDRGAVNLENFWVYGTANDVVQIGYVPQ